MCWVIPALLMICHETYKLQTQMKISILVRDEILRDLVTLSELLSSTWSVYHPVPSFSKCIKVLRVQLLDK